MANDWRAGYGVIQHSADTIARVEALLDQLLGLQILSDRERAYALLAAADASVSVYRKYEAFVSTGSVENVVNFVGVLQDGSTISW